MPTEVDHDAIKEQMVLILQGNSNLYTTTAEANKIRSILAGYPDGETGFDKVFPQIYITNSNPLERISQKGPITRGSEELGPLEHNIRYRIVIAVSGKNSRDTENKLDDFQKLTLETLESDHQFKNGGAAIVDDSRPEMVETFKVNLDGNPVQGRTITYLVSQVTI